MRRSKRNRRKTEPVRIRLPKLPRIRIDWRMVLGPLVVAALVVLAGRAGRVLLDRPVEALIVEGTFQRVTPVQIEAALDAAHSQSFFSLDLDALRRDVTAIDWVDTATLRRVWPGTLRVHVVEHQAAARWGEKGLLDARGELFTEDARHEYAELPRLAGPVGSEARVARLYLDVRGRLADANLMLDSIRMDERGAIEIALGGGQVVRLGRSEIQSRLERFFTVAAPALAAELARVDYIDLRYPNGFAVGWREPLPAAETQLAEVDRRG